MCAGPLSESLTGGSTGLTYADFAWTLGLYVILLGCILPIYKGDIAGYCWRGTNSRASQTVVQILPFPIYCCQGKYLANLSKSPFSHV